MCAKKVTYFRCDERERERGGGRERKGEGERGGGREREIMREKGGETARGRRGTYTEHAYILYYSRYNKP